MLLSPRPALDKSVHSFTADGGFFASFEAKKQTLKYMWLGFSSLMPWILMRLIDKASFQKFKSLCCSLIAERVLFDGIVLDNSDDPAGLPDWAIRILACSGI